MVAAGSTGLAQPQVQARSAGEESRDERLAPRFQGFDLAVSLTDSTGLSFAPGSYYNVLSLWLEPSFHLGRRLLPGTWWAPFAVSLRMPIDFELSSNDPRFRGPGFSSASLYATPEAIPIAVVRDASLAAWGTTDGAVRNPVQVGDLWLTVQHPKLFKVPALDVVVGASLRLVAPVSPQSRNTGLVTTTSLGVFLDRVLGPLDVNYAGRFAKYFFTRTSPAIASSLPDPVINGQTTELWRPSSTGIPNPDYGYIHALGAAVQLPWGLSLGASYTLFHVKPLPLSGCGVPDVPTADVCTDGPAVGPVAQGTWRHDQAFQANLDWTGGPVTLSLGLSTFRGLRAPDGTVAQPFVHVTRDNATTLYLSVSTSAEELARALDKESKP